MSETEHRKPAPEISEETSTDLASEEEPVVTGTLFLTLVFLMMIFGFWILFYITLLDR